MKMTILCFNCMSLNTETKMVYFDFTSAHMHASMHARTLDECCSRCPIQAHLSPRPGMRFTSSIKLQRERWFSNCQGATLNPKPCSLSPPKLVQFTEMTSAYLSHCCRSLKPTAVQELRMQLQLWCCLQGQALQDFVQNDLFAPITQNIYVDNWDGELSDLVVSLSAKVTRSFQFPLVQ